MPLRSWVKMMMITEVDFTEIMRKIREISCQPIKTNRGYRPNCLFRADIFKILCIFKPTRTFPPSTPHYITNIKAIHLQSTTSSSTIQNGTFRSFRRRFSPFPCWFPPNIAYLETSTSPDSTSNHSCYAIAHWTSCCSRSDLRCSCCSTASGQWRWWYDEQHH